MRRTVSVALRVASTLQSPEIPASLRACWFSRPTDTSSITLNDPRESTSRSRSFACCFRMPSKLTPRSGRISYFTKSRNVSTQQQVLGSRIMAPPKQSTLGYVKPSQRTLTCVLLSTNCVVQSRVLTKSSLLSKFFGGPNGAKSAPQQSKLAFSSKAQASEHKPEKTEDDSTNGEVKLKEEDVEMDESVEAVGEPETPSEVKAETSINGTNGRYSRLRKRPMIFSLILHRPRSRSRFPRHKPQKTRVRRPNRCI